ncbi:MAG: quinone oxidoreductase family protein [Rectinemataceae bacterium]
MKAAVLYEFGAVPRYEEFPDPVINDGELGVKVEAVILDYALKGLASGTHFASKQFYPSFPAIVGRSGVGLLDDGTLVSFQCTRLPYGSMAERVAVQKSVITPIPPEIDAVQAAVVPSAAQSSLLPLRYTAKLRAGETVLINGATSVSGMLAVKIAKSLGAGRVVGTGRNPASGERAKEAGADAFISLNQSDEKLAEALRREAGEGYDVILDYLCGHPTEVLLSTFTPTAISFARKRTRLVLIGVLAGRSMQLSAESVVTSGLEIYGFGAPNNPETLKNRAEGVAQIWDMLKRGELSIDAVRLPLSDIKKAWELEEHGRRIVIVP